MHKLSYQLGTSLIHRLYPMTKFAWLLAGTLIVFIIQDGRLLMMTAWVFTVLLVFTNRNIWRIRGFRYAFLTGAGLLILYLIFEKSGQVVLDPGFELLKITSEGVMLGLRFSGRFLTIVMMSYIFILTTDPGDLAYALMKIGLPYRYGFMLVTALRLAPVLEDEGRIIYQAQLVRGIRYDQASLRKVILFAQQFMTPVLISALRRADKLVFSMEGRGFGAQSTRTFRKRPIPTRFDLYISIGLTIYFSALVFLDMKGIG